MAEKKFKKKPRIGRMPDPGDWNEVERDPQEFAGIADRILLKLKSAPGAAWDHSFKFFTDIEGKVNDIKASIVDRGKVTDGQASAMASWEAAIDRAIEKHLPKGPP